MGWCQRRAEDVEIICCAREEGKEKELYAKKERNSRKVGSASALQVSRLVCLGSARFSDWQLKFVVI